MSDAEHGRLAEAFDRVRRADPGERLAVLDEACGDDGDLRAEVEILLSHDRIASGFLAPPPTPETLDIEDAGDPPDRIGRYRILGVLGHGGMGVVYRAEQDDTHREVAVKVIPPDLTSPRRLRRFEAEAEVLGRLEHPGIARIYDAATSQRKGVERPYVAMELVEGPPIDIHARDARLDRPARAELVARVCDAVHHAHLKGVIHRDLKPDNIHVDATGAPKVLDFGVARLIDRDLRATAGRTRTGDLVGTVPYMSPEQVTGDLASLDVRSDVYALGVILYELLVGTLPYDLEGKSLVEQARIITDVEPAPPAQADPALRGDLGIVVMKALEKDPARRYQSASALGDDLRRALRDEPIEARPATRRYQLRKFARRHRGLVMAVVGAFLALVITVVVVSVLLSISQHARGQATILGNLALEAFEALVPSGDRPERLERAVVRIDRVEDPAARAALQMGLGSGLYALGQYDRAADLLEASLATHRDLYGDDAPATLDVMGVFGQVEHDRGNLDAARTLYRQVWAGWERRGDDPDAMLNARHDAALIAQDEGRLDEAEQELRRVLQLQTWLLDEGDAGVLTTLNSLAVLLREKGRSEEALELFQPVVAARQAHPRWRDDPVALTALNTYATLLYDHGRFAEAEALFLEVLENRRRVLGPTHQDTLIVLNNLAGQIAQRGRFAEAEPLLREAFEIQRQTLGLRHEDTLNSLNGLAFVLLRQGKGEEALRETQVLVDASAASTPPDGWVHGVFLLQHGRALRAVGRSDEGRRVVAEAVAWLKRTVGMGSPHTRNAIAELERIDAAAGGT